jgi:hypothetical protein
MTKFVVEVGEMLYPIRLLEVADFREIAKQDIRGVPAYCCEIDNTNYFWPRPFEQFKVFKLEVYEYTNNRLK